MYVNSKNLLCFVLMHFQRNVDDLILWDRLPSVVILNWQMYLMCIQLSPLMRNDCVAEGYEKMCAVSKTKKRDKSKFNEVEKDSVLQMFQ